MLDSLLLNINYFSFHQLHILYQPQPLSRVYLTPFPYTVKLLCYLDESDVELGERDGRRRDFPRGEEDRL